MSLLIAGVVLWSVAHFFPAIAPGIRAALIVKFGEKSYRGLFAICIFVALGLIIFGWKAASPAPIYVPPMLGSPVPAVLLAIALLFFVASKRRTNVKRYVRHPQMGAVLFWSTAHLLTNGDSRSLLLFGGLGLWAALEIVFIGKRDGKWEKPHAVPILQDVVTVIIAAVAFAALVYFHASLFGVAAILR